jgi:hypothetical protein
MAHRGRRVGPGNRGLCPVSIARISVSLTDPACHVAPGKAQSGAPAQRFLLFLPDSYYDDAVPRAASHVAACEM